MKNHDRFTNSSLGRARQKRTFRTILKNALTRPKKGYSNVGLVEDSMSSAAIVRVILGLLVLHVIIIGGVLLKGRFDQLASGVAVSRSVLPPPVATPAQEATPPATQPLVVENAAPGNHITQSSPAPDVTQPAEPANIFPDTPASASVVATTPAPVPTPVETTAAPVEPAPAAPAAPAQEETTTIRYLVNSGETWYGIAQKHGITQEALRAANPVAARKAHLYQGSYINVPVKADSAAARNAAGNAPAPVAVPTYTVKRGDTLARIARRHKMTTSQLMQLNNLSEKDARYLKVGQKLKVSK